MSEIRCLKSDTVLEVCYMVSRNRYEWDTMSEERYGVGSVLYGVEESIRVGYDV